MTTLRTRIAEIVNRPSVQVEWTNSVMDGNWTHDNAPIPSHLALSIRIAGTDQATKQEIDASLNEGKVEFSVDRSVRPEHVDDSRQLQEMNESAKAGFEQYKDRIREFLIDYCNKFVGLQQPSAVALLEAYGKLAPRILTTPDSWFDTVLNVNLDAGSELFDALLLEGVLRAKMKLVRL